MNTIYLYKILFSCLFVSILVCLVMLHCFYSSSNVIFLEGQCKLCYIPECMEIEHFPGACQSIEHFPGACQSINTNALYSL
jgi:hypothetical protein